MESVPQKSTRYLAWIILQGIGSVVCAVLGCIVVVLVGMPNAIDEFFAYVFFFLFSIGGAIGFRYSLCCWQSAFTTAGIRVHTFSGDTKLMAWKDISEFRLVKRGVRAAMMGPYVEILTFAGVRTWLPDDLFVSTTGLITYIEEVVGENRLVNR